MIQNSQQQQRKSKLHTSTALTNEYKMKQFRLQNDLYCVEWDVKLYYTYPYLSTKCIYQ